MTDDSHDARSILRSLDSEITLRPFLVSTSSSYSPVDGHNVADRASLKSFDTFNSSTSSSSSIEKLKSLGNRIRRKPLPGYLKGSIRRHPAAEIEPTRIGRGVWKDQLLVDRSLRTMAATMTIFAIAMIILIATYAKHFNSRTNPNTSSVGGGTKSCKDVTKTNTALLLLINVCATMVLGMSNTYQQLVTSLKVSDIKYVLSKFGDSRVGTNSPFSINHKQDGKKRAWSAWLLLILTSMPVHFLANSLIGPSYIQKLPGIVEYKETANLTSSYSYMNSEDYSERINNMLSFPCWSAFRTGTPHYPKSTDILEGDSGIFGAAQDRFGITWQRMQVHYATGNCSQYAQTAADIAALEVGYIGRTYYSKQYAEGNCFMGENLYCTLHVRAVPTSLKP